MRSTKMFAAVAVSLVAGLMLGCDGKGGGADKTPTTDDQKTLYALGATIGRNLKPFELTEEELAYVRAGLSDQVMGRELKAPLDQYGPKVNEMFRTRSQRKGHEFVEKAAGEQGAEKLPSGVVYKMEQEGTGPSPTATDRVKVNYRGTLIDGTEFDSSQKNGGPVTFPLNGVIPCWTQGVAKMKVGGKAKLTCPADTAYGDMGRPPRIPGGSALVFDVELISIEPNAAPPPGMPAMPTAMDGGMAPDAGTKKIFPTKKQ